MEDLENYFILLHESDNVAVALQEIPDTSVLQFREAEIVVSEPIEMGHKMAIRSIRCGESVTKCGVSIGSATRDISPGRHVHMHNLQSDYSRRMASPEELENSHGA